MSDLKVIKEIFNSQVYDMNGVVKLDRDHVEWLIEQAKRVEVLERRLKELSQTSYCIICGDNASEVKEGRFYCQECIDC